MTSLGKALLTLFADVEIHGREKLPKKGPVLLAGNHAAILEVVMLAAYTPGNVEFLELAIFLLTEITPSS